MLIELLKPDFIFQDERGDLTQLVHEGFQQVNVIRSVKGVIRGDHYHKLNREAFYVIEGEFKLDVQKDGIVEHYVFKKGEMFLIPEYVMHSFEFVEDTLLVSFYDKGVELDNGEKDIYA
ncbi:cupin domain-containing protein [Anaerosporobacter faecicola]|uniref:cupin domain-containing protein n=1 Tax=Anaerosporobacter faecicola TaxID=2718714 RepID=UPI00143AFE53|nr:cupin domain-containing protein [Anaerosporobacter faecicola]